MEAADWANLSDDELLERKISQLGLKLEGTELQPVIPAFSLAKRVVLRLTRKPASGFARGLSVKPETDNGYFFSPGMTASQTTLLDKPRLRSNLFQPSRRIAVLLDAAHSDSIRHA